MKKIVKKQILVSIVATTAIALTGFTLQVKGLENSAEKQLLSLGYTKQEATQMVEYTNMLDIAKVKENDLQVQYETAVVLLEQEVGLDKEVLPNDADKTAVDKVKNVEFFVQEQKTIFRTQIEQSLSILTSHNVSVEINETMTLKAKETLLSNKVNELLEELKANAQKLGATPNQIEGLLVGTPLEMALNLEGEIARLNEQNSQQGYYFDRSSAMEMFNQVNAYRASQGLVPYTYNYDKQACVDLEASAYASNGNPHNWACKGIANENAGIASEKSNFVKVAMDFFISDPPHHAVLVGPHQSAAVSIVNKNGICYMILDVFN